MIETLCGCECHQIDLNDADNVVTMNQKQWKPICALKETFRLLALTREELEKVKNQANLRKTEAESLRLLVKDYQALRKNIEKVLCPQCFDKLGEDFIGSDDGEIMCRKCMQEKYPSFF